MILLAFLAVLAYGLLLPQMGFYWDELPISWIRYELGPEALTRYFSTNRPIWGLLYQLTTRYTSSSPDLLGSLCIILALVDRYFGLGDRSRSLARSPAICPYRQYVLSLLSGLQSAMDITSL